MVARSEPPSDPRPYVRVATDLPINPKLAAIDDPQAGWAYVVSFCYCGGSLTDGHFPLKTVLRMANVADTIAAALAEQGLWHLPGHDCDKCPQPKNGHAYVHDYLQHQRSSDEVRQLTDKRREAGRKGAESRWGKPGSKPKPEASVIANAKQVPLQMDGKAMAEERRGEEIPLPTEGGSPAAAAAPADDSLFTVQPSARAPKPRRPAAAETTGNAGDVVAAFIEGAKERNRTVPPPIIKQVGATAKQLIQAGTVPHDQIVNAAREMGRKGWKDLNMQLFRGSEAPNGGGYVAQRVNTDKPGSHTEAWNRRRAQHAHQQ